MKELTFQKYHGCGNDFIFIEHQKAQELIAHQALEQYIQAICDRHFGIGADGLIFAEKIGHKYKMHYYNADGSKAMMCGNGMRAFRQYLRDTYDEDSTQLEILTSESKVVVCCLEDGMIDVNIGVANEAESLLIEGQQYFQIYTMTDHVVSIHETIPIHWQKIGAEVEQNSVFPKGTNVNFVEIIDSGKIKLETWERGAGPTKACGTGACASAIVYRKLFAPQENRIEVLVSGGQLIVEFRDDEVHLIGMAARIAKGTFFYNK